MKKGVRRGAKRGEKRKFLYTHEQHVVRTEEPDVIGMTLREYGNPCETIPDNR